MQRASFHCAICGGPLCNRDLRGSASAALRNETPGLGVRDDTCSCIVDDLLDPSESLQVYEGLHLWDCNIRGGYDAVVLSEGQIQVSTAFQRLRKESLT